MKRAYVVNQADLRMDGDLAMNVKRVLPVTQADVASAAAQGIFWNVKRYEVVNTLDNMRGGTQRILKVNAPAPGVQRAFLTSATTIITVLGVPPLVLPDAVDAHIPSLIAFGGATQQNPLVPKEYKQTEYTIYQGSPVSTGINGFDDSTSEIYLRWKTDTQSVSSNYQSVFVVWQSNSYNSWRMLTYLTSVDQYYVYGNSKSPVTTSTVAIGDIHDIVCKSGNFIIDGTSFSTSVSSDATPSNKELSIGGSQLHSYFYSIKVKRQGQWIADFVPVKRISDSAAGLYDVIAGNFITNSSMTAGPEIIPTPDEPIDIVCNNGALKYRDTELPTGYRRILGMTMNNNCYYEITGFKMNGSDTLRFSFTRTGANACNVLGAYDGPSAQTNYSLYAGTANSANYLRYNGGTYNSYAIADKKYEVVLTPTGSDGMETDSTWAAKTFTSTTDFCVGTTSSTATSSKMTGSIHGAVIVDGRLKLIPCERISDGEIGYYNTYNETFYEPIGTTPTSLGYDYSSYELYTEGPVETIEIEDDQYATVSTATCENLLSIDDYTDEQNIITGQVTRKIGVKVFNGTEDWISNTTNIYQVGLADSLKPTESPQRIAIYSTHFVGTTEANANMPNNSIKQGNFTSYANNGGIGIKMTGLSGVTAFKQWLVAQRDAGTPVIIAYVLKNNVTEQVTAQSMSTVVGDNTAEITQASMAGLELQVTYMGGVELTVEEVEDAQLSPDVEVTIE